VVTGDHDDLATLPTESQRASASSPRLAPVTTTTGGHSRTGHSKIGHSHKAGLQVGFDGFTAPSKP